ncbi:hypothetical protein UPYG_G00064210 [Umbra pygmaea]|uniref:ODAD1 central coiled coil region domain-containing protein n=1 Tax=Umbra pygmaea TaxID=75934 RepID=A0ABD0XA14_UMBPY
MPFSIEAMKPPLHDQITELQRKIQLLEGEKSAYYESSQSSIKKNKDFILHLRQENKRLHRKLADALAGDEHVIRDAFQSRGMETVAFRNMSGKAAVKVLDQKVCDKMKKLNALKHTRQTYRRRLEDLQTQYQSMKSDRKQRDRDAEGANTEVQINGEGDEEHPQKNLRVLENRLEKAQLKFQEAEHISRSYLKLKAHLQEESLTFQSQLDSLEAEILSHRHELKELQFIKSDAHLCKEAAKVELQHQEEQVYKERKEREQILTRYKKQAEEHKALAERVERRRGAMHSDEQSNEPQGSGTVVGDDERAISTFEDAFRHIKEATGVTDTQEVLERFSCQDATQKHLDKLKEENERTLLQLKEERDRLQENFQEIKYSGESSLSSSQNLLEECECHLKAEQERRDVAKERLDLLTRTLNTARAGVEHLADKLQYIKLQDKDQSAQLPPDSAEHVLELLDQAERKLLLLQEELKGKDLAAIMKEMKEEEFHASIAGNLPTYNTRIKLPEAQRQDPYDEDEESEEDEGDLITRATLKRQSQLIIDSKTKRKTRIRKKKGKL